RVFHVTGVQTCALPIYADVLGAGLAGDLRMPDAAVSRIARAVARKTGSYKGGRHADVVGAGLAGDLRMPDAAVSRTARAVARKKIGRASCRDRVESTVP